jgi:zinc transport system ATP-binding protein
MPTDPAVENAPPLLRCERLVIGHRGRPLLPPIDLAIRPGMMLAVLGRNGSGKSTFFKTLLGFLPAVSGHVRQAAPAPQLAYMAQAATLDGTVPVRARDVVAWGGLQGLGFLRPLSQRRAQRSVDTALEAAQADSIAGAFVRDLSEGQRAKVLLARVLAARAQVAFLDEPTAAMDAVAEQRTFALLRRESHEHGLAVVVITHLLGLVRRFADQVLYLDRDDGLALAAPPQVVFAHPTFQRQYGEVDSEANGNGNRNGDRGGFHR